MSDLLFERPGFHWFPAGAAPTDLAGTARRAGLELRTADVSRVGDRDELLAVLRATFALPPYVHKNWDSLDEALRDLAWLPRRARVVVFTGWASFAAALPEAAEMLVRLLGAAIAAHAADAALHVVLI